MIGPFLEAFAEPDPPRSPWPSVALLFAAVAFTAWWAHVLVTMP